MHRGYYTTLTERLVKKDVPYWSHKISPYFTDFIERLFEHEGMKLTIPVDGKEYVYHLTRANDGKVTNFVKPYNPVIVYKSHSYIKNFVGVFYADYYIARELDLWEELKPLITDLVSDPEGFMKHCSKLWGRCVICGRQLSAETSLSRAMGPVCYSRAYNMVQWKSEYEERYTLLDVIQEDNASVFNPIEQRTVTDLESRLNILRTIGASVNINNAITIIPVTRLDVIIQGHYIVIENSVKYRILVPLLYKLLSDGVIQDFSVKKDEDRYLISPVSLVETLKDLGVEMNISIAPVVSKREKQQKSLETAVSTNSTLKKSEVPNKDSKPTMRKEMYTEEDANNIYVYNWPYMRRGEIKLGPDVKWDSNRKAWVLPIKYRAQFNQL
jgi:hypothetical protein